jgi:uracil-DNA glycosylase
VVTAAAAAGKQPQLSRLLIEPSWLHHMGAEFDKPYFKQLQKFLDGEWQAHSVYPPPEMIFR